MSQNKYEERNFILEFIKTYQLLPALWDVKSKDYNNRQIKSEAYLVLLNKFNQRYPDATREDVIKKINSLRTNFRKEMKRISDVKNNNKNAIVESNLWYFKEMSFLLDQEIIDSLRNNTVKQEVENVDDSSSIDLDDVPKENTVTINKNLKRCPEDVAVVPCKHFKTNENELENIAKVWIIELQKMNPEQQIYAKKAINDIIYEGQLGNLNRNSIQINPSLK